MAMVPSLTSATVVCRAQPRLAPLKHVTAAVSSFLDYSARWSIASACARGTASPDGDGVSLRLLERVAAHRAAAATRNSLASKRQRDGFYRQWEFTRAAAAAAARGDVQALKWLVDMFPNCRVTVAVEEAAKHGQLQILQWLLDKSRRQELTVFWGRESCFSPEAARNGDLEMVRWLCEVRGEWSPYAAVLAASGGHLEVLEWLRTNLFSSSSSSISMDDAASRGHLDVLQWLQNHSGYATQGAMNKAATTGELEILMWLFANHRHQLGRDRLRIYALGKFYILHWLKIEAGASEREAFMGEANPLAQG
ncbi:Ankyrin repeat-containing domain [Phytophthora cactorum]|nr:Ankyrin repeat-containing domain [Phytophthora cactorum]